MAGVHQSTLQPSMLLVDIRCWLWQGTLQLFSWILQNSEWRSLSASQIKAKQQGLVADKAAKTDKPRYWATILNGKHNCGSFWWALAFHGVSYNHINAGRFQCLFKLMLGRCMFLNYSDDKVFEYKALEKGLWLVETWKSRFWKVKFYDKNVDVISLHSNHCPAILEWYLAWVVDMSTSMLYIHNLFMLSVLQALAPELGRPALCTMECIQHFTPAPHPWNLKFETLKITMWRKRWGWWKMTWWHDDWWLNVRLLHKSSIHRCCHLWPDDSTFGIRMGIFPLL